MILSLVQIILSRLLKECLNNMTIEQQIEQNIPSKKRKNKNSYNYIRNNEVEFECKKKERDYD